MANILTVFSYLSESVLDLFQCKHPAEKLIIADSILTNIDGDFTKHTVVMTCTKCDCKIEKRAVFFTHGVDAFLRNKNG